MAASSRSDTRRKRPAGRFPADGGGGNRTRVRSLACSGNNRNAPRERRMPAPALLDHGGVVSVCPVFRWPTAGAAPPKPLVRASARPDLRPVAPEVAGSSPVATRRRRLPVGRAKGRLRSGEHHRAHLACREHRGDHRLPLARALPPLRPARASTNVSVLNPHELERKPRATCPAGPRSSSVRVAASAAGPPPP